MAKPNPFSEAITNIADDFRSLKSKAPKKEAPPVGQVSVTPTQFRQRLGEMTPTQRQELLGQPGMRDQILKLLKDEI